MKRVTLPALMLLLCAIAITAHAETTPVRTLLGKRELVYSPSAVYDGKRVLVPLTLLDRLGASFVETDSSRVHITSASGAAGDVGTIDVDGAAMVALDDLLKVTGGTYAWDESRRAIKLMAHLQSVEFVDGMLRINCSFPVVCSTHKWENKVIVDLGDTKLASDASEVFIGSPVVSKARLGQPEEDRARVVLDLAKDAGYRLVSAQPSSQVLLEVGENIQSPPSAKPAAASTAQQRQPYTIQEIRLESADERRFNVIIVTSAKADVSSSFSVDPSTVSLRLERATLSASVVPVQETHPLLSSLQFSQISNSPPAARVVLNLSRIVAYSVSVEDRQVVLSVRLPEKAGGTLADKLIVVDPGHGGREKGACGPNCYEKDINLRIARALAEALTAEGARVRLTRDGDETMGLAARPGVAKSIGADFFISVHCNSNGAAESASGIETYYHMYEPSPRVLASAVHQGVCLTTGMCDRKARSDRSLYSTGLSVLRNLSGSGIPGVLVECGYVNNTSDRARLLNQAYREKLAAGIVLGLKAYVEGTPLR